MDTAVVVRRCLKHALGLTAILGCGFILLNTARPDIAARLTGVFSRWRQYNEGRQIMMQQQLQRILDTGSLSKDVYEIASKSLGE